MSEWETVIGLEVHTELATKTKLFCGCRNAFGDEPNVNICPTCIGLPGALPVLNEQAVELAMRIGAALHCDIRPSVFARKNYFYPDQAKDYQISQYDLPLNADGWLGNKGVQGGRVDLFPVGGLSEGTRSGREKNECCENAGEAKIAAAHWCASFSGAGAWASLVDSIMPMVRLDSTKVALATRRMSALVTFSMRCS